MTYYRNQFFVLMMFSSRDSIVYPALPKALYQQRKIAIPHGVYFWGFQFSLPFNRYKPKNYRFLPSPLSPPPAVVQLLVHWVINLLVKIQIRLTPVFLGSFPIVNNELKNSLTLFYPVNTESPYRQSLLCS